MDDKIAAEYGVESVQEAIEHLATVLAMHGIQPPVKMVFAKSDYQRLRSMMIKKVEAQGKYDMQAIMNDKNSIVQSITCMGKIDIAEES